MTGTALIKPGEFRALKLSDEALAQSVAALTEQEVGEFDLTRIKIPSGGGTTFEIPSIRGDVSTRELQGVIVFAKFSRSYWHTRYTGGNEPPTCSSPDGKTARPREIEDPETGALTLPEIPAQTDPQSGRLLCDTCHFAEFGSGRNDDGTPAKRQACKQTRLIFLLLPDRLLPAVLVLPPTSLKNAKNYLLGLVDEGLLQHAVITRVTLKKTKNEGTPDYSVAEFRVGDELTPEQAQKAYAYAEAARPRFSRIVARASDLPQDA